MQQLPPLLLPSGAPRPARPVQGDAQDPPAPLVSLVASSDVRDLLRALGSDDRCGTVTSWLALCMTSHSTCNEDTWRDIVALIGPPAPRVPDGVKPYDVVNEDFQKLLREEDRRRENQLRRSGMLLHSDTYDEQNGNTWRHVARVIAARGLLQLPAYVARAFVAAERKSLAHWGSRTDLPPVLHERLKLSGAIPQLEPLMLQDLLDVEHRGLADIEVSRWAQLQGRPVHTWYAIMAGSGMHVPTQAVHHIFRSGGGMNTVLRTTAPSSEPQSLYQITLGNFLGMYDSYVRMRLHPAMRDVVVTNRKLFFRRSES